VLGFGFGNPRDRRLREGPWIGLDTPNFYGNQHCILQSQLCG
jgi:hypothetical protein